MKHYFLATALSISIGTLLSGTSVSAQTQLYQWVDEDGVKHFSQQPPPEALDLQPTTIDGAPVISGGEPRPYISARSTESPTDPTTSATEPSVPEKDADRCAAATESVRTLTESARVSLLDEETGEYNYIDDEERQRQLKLWQEEQNRYC